MLVGWVAGRPGRAQGRDRGCGAVSVWCSGPVPPSSPPTLVNTALGPSTFLLSEHCPSAKLIELFAMM